MSGVSREPLAGGFGVPLGVKLAAADSARALLGRTGAAEILLVGDGSDPDRQDFPAEFRALLHGEPIRYIDINKEAVFPATYSIVLLDTSVSDGPTSTREVYDEVIGDWSNFDVPGTDLAYATGTLPAGSYPTAGVKFDVPPLLANFVRITGYNAPRSIDRALLWDLFWRTADNPDPSDYHIFNHLIGESGERLAQADGRAFPGIQWRPGDVVLSRFLLPMSEDANLPHTMRVGMYRYPSLENVPVLDEAANPAADAVEISLIK